jgi:FdhD protein
MRADSVSIPDPASPYSCLTREGERLAPRTRLLAEETGIALVYDGSTEAVMMATPADLHDFAVGFSRNEGLIESPRDLIDFAPVHGEFGIELRMWLAKGPSERHRQRRRRMAGPTGCGLCGIESLAETVRPVAPLTAEGRFPEAGIAEALAGLAGRQKLSHQTQATHAAAFYMPDNDLIVREDVGRHNALDKLAGALCLRNIDAARGAVVITSRVSVEMVQKTARIGAPILIAMSAPTALAVRTAETANITLVAVARGESYQLFSHGHRIDRAPG